MPGRPRLGNGAPHDDGPHSIYSPIGASRFRRNGSIHANGTETIGFFPEEESGKPARESAENLPFNVRTSQTQSESSSNVDESKHSQDMADTPELVSALETYFPLHRTS
jgi:hypothetical protein